MDEPDARLHGLCRHPAARHRSVHDRRRAHEARLPDGDPADRPVDLRPAAQFSLRPRAARDLGHRTGSRRSRHPRFALQARGLRHRRALRLGGRLAVCACRRLHQPGSVRAANGRGHVHHALCRRHRHGAGSGDRRRRRFAAAADCAQHRPFPGHRLRPGPAAAAHLRAEGIVRAVRHRPAAPRRTEAPGAERWRCSRCAI